MKVVIPNKNAPIKIENEISSQVKLFEEQVEKILPKDEMPKARLDSPEFPWVFQEFPSHFIPYNGERFFVKPLDWSLLGRLHSIRLKKNPKSFSMMLDVFNNCLNGIDVRDLTMGDFYSFMYWIRINSYPKTPFSMEFSSKYGGPPQKVFIRMNKAERDAKVERIEKLNQSTKDKNWYDLEIAELNMTLDEYKAWQEKGIRFPTVRDFELLSTENIPDDLQYLSKFSQYIKVEEEVTEDTYFEVHMNKLNSLGLDFIETINDFAEKITHGVIEKIGVTIAKVNEQVYLDKLTRQRDIFHNVVMNALEDENSDKTQIAIVTSSLIELNNEIDIVTKAMENNETIIPEEEEVRISINLDSFFPIL